METTHNKLDSARDVCERQQQAQLKLFQECFFYTKQVQTNAMWDGIESESSIIQTFENETGQKVHKSGFFVSETHPF